MAKKSGTKDSVVLALELLKRIPKSYQVTAKELHAQLTEIGIQRDLRTIQRNLEMLCDHFDIIRDDRSKPYGYKWNKDSRSIAVSKLSTQEALLLCLAEQYLIKLLPSNITNSLNPFFQQARSALNPLGTSSKDSEWLKKVRVVSETQPLLPPKISTEVFSAISEALYRNCYLKIGYYNSKQEQKKATVMPLGLAQQGHRMYLVCRFHGYENERSIAIHRVNKAEVSTLSFERPKEFKLSQYDADGRFGFGEGRKYQLEFCITKTAGFHLTETALSDDQKITVDEHSYKVQATVTQSKQLERWLKGFEDQVWDIKFKEL